MNNQRNHIVIRVTALDARPSAAIAAIAAVAFNPETGEVSDRMFCRVDIESSQREGGTIDASAVKWLLRQTAEARAEFVSDDSVVLREALAKLNLFVLRQGAFGNCPVWFKNLDNDAPIIYSAMAAAGIAPAWQYARAHHVDTLIESIPPTIRHSRIVAWDYAACDLLSDALNQVRLISSVWNVLAAMSAAYINSVPDHLAMLERS